MSDRSTYTYLNPETGNLELRDIHTDELVAIGTDSHTLQNLEPEHMIEVKLDSGDTVLIPKGVNPETLLTSGYMRRWQFGEVIADIICQKITEGQGLTNICKEPGMPPYHVICRWRRSNPDFRQALEQAYADRAEFIYDQIMQLADDITNKMKQSVDVEEEKVRLQQLKTKYDMLKWGTEVGNPERFGKKQKITGEIQTKVSIVLDTGIRRPGDEGYIVDESAKLVQEQQKKLFSGGDQ